MWKMANDKKSGGRIPESPEIVFTVGREHRFPPKGKTTETLKLGENV
jgi:hypothetical protein